MCTFKDEQTVLVCEVAMSRVRGRLQEAFGETVQYTPVDGQATLVQVLSALNSTRFHVVVREAIASVQNASISKAQP